MAKTTDRTLLEQALLADGRKINATKQADRDMLVDPATASLWLTDGTTAWDPIKHNGDAFRLAVRLNLAVAVDPQDGGVSYCGQDGDPAVVVAVLEEHNGDPYAATRRAITRAAALIGVRMTPT